MIEKIRKLFEDLQDMKTKDPNSEFMRLYAIQRLLPIYNETFEEKK